MQEIKQMERLPLAGYAILSTTAGALCARLHDRLVASNKTVLLFANTNFALKCQKMRTWLNSDEVLIVNDGIGLDIAALLIHGNRYKENLNGTDFSPYFLKLNTTRKIFLLGGKPGVAEKVGGILARDFGSLIVGSVHGYSQMSSSVLCDEINRSEAEIVLVAMGNPIQEEWIQAHMSALNANLFIGVGALFDFLSGGAQRAPNWIQKIRFEWLYRLSQEPTRLMRRYTVDIASFLFLCLRCGKNTNKKSM